MKLNEVKEVIENNKESRERNVLEVRNYYNALMFLSKEAEHNNKITEDLILKVHNLVSGKLLSHKNAFRDGQNVVQDSETGKIVYMPPEVKDVKELINQMIEEFNAEEFVDALF